MGGGGGVCVRVCSNARHWCCADEESSMAMLASLRSTLVAVHKASFLLSRSLPVATNRRHLCFSKNVHVDSVVSHTNAAGKVVVKGMAFTEIEDWITSSGYKSSQAMMLWRWLYGNGKWAQNVDELQGFNKSFLAMLRQTAEFSALSLEDIRIAADGTRKMIFGLGDGDRIETVVIPGPRNRVTVCVSSQVGCAMNCQFCYTGRMGLKRNLTTAQIVEQVVIAQRRYANEIGPITNVVFMGMGEPLHNINNVLRALYIMIDLHGLHFSPHKVTVSTSGLVPQLRRYCRESPCALAVSLNATTDEVRNWIMPINRKYNLNTLLGALKEELSAKKDFKVLIEYVLLKGINDRYCFVESSFYKMARQTYH